MRVRRSITAAGVPVVLGTTGGLAAPAAASAHSATHTLRFTSVAREFVFFTKTTFPEQDTDVSGAAKIVGFDEVSGVLGKTASTADIAFVLDGGFLDGTLKVSRKTGAAAGPVTRGTGRFSGATGTITGKSVGKNKEAITITYRT